MANSTAHTRTFMIRVMGRTLEHLGVQMYKRRDAALAELVANSWDAGATIVEITIPEPGVYDKQASVITLVDNGAGMTDDAVQEEYLVIGRNRRSAGQAEANGRKVMGRKGIGKLAGFGLAQRMRVETWCEGTLTTVLLDAEQLKANAGDVRHLPLDGMVRPVAATEQTQSGTRVLLQQLKHSTPIHPDSLIRSLARRFSRTVLGHMSIHVNGQPVDDTGVDLVYRDPESGENAEDLPDGHTIRWWAGFSSKVLPSEMQGFVILVRGKTAQAPPYFFSVESKASGQHGTKYLTGVIEADYLDDGTDDATDRISTDRQEIDWADPSTRELKAWGDRLVRRLLIEHVNQRGEHAENIVEEDPNLAKRLDALDPPSRKQVKKFVRSLGASTADPEKVEGLADTIIRAYEYRQFHDYIEQIDAIADDPDQLEATLSLMRGWKVLESRAVLEVIKGRLDIIQKFYHLIVDDAPERAGAIGRDNLHDLIADYPWLINPDWQVLSEEKRITTQLREWGNQDIDQGDRTRYDFLALEGDGRLVVIEIKRAGHAVGLDDLHQLNRYAHKLGQARDNIHMAFITGEKYALPTTELTYWKGRNDLDLLTWRGVHERTRGFYEHYRAVLEGDVDDDSFNRKTREVARTRTVLDSAAYRGREERAAGLGPQDVDFESPGEGSTS